MSHHIPFEIQSEIIKMLPVKSLVQFRSVSKQWKAFIDNPTFINNYHINHRNPQHHLLVQYELDDTLKTYTSIVDNNTFPQQKFPVTAPESLSLSRNTFILGSVEGLLCFYCYGGPNSKKMAVIWNPTVRKSVAIDIPSHKAGCYTVVGFGVCPDTSHPKLVRIIVDKVPSMWEVDVFTLSTRVWRTVYTSVPFKSCDLSLLPVFVDGVIYFRASAHILDHGSRFNNFVISFDLKSEKFGEVCLPQRLVHTHDLEVTKVNESLGLLEYHYEGDMNVCGVWSRKDGANNPFTKLYTIKVEGKWLFKKVLGFRNNGGKSLFRRVLGFRNNGEVVMEEANNYKESRIGVYEPLSGHIKDVGINGKRGTLYVSSYMETLLLLDEPHSIIH